MVINQILELLNAYKTKRFGDHWIKGTNYKVLSNQLHVLTKIFNTSVIYSNIIANTMEEINVFQEIVGNYCVDINSETDKVFQAVEVT